MLLSWKKKVPPSKSLAEVAAEKAKVLRGWLQEIDEMEGADPEEAEDAARRFAMRLNDVIRQTDVLLEKYDQHVAQNFANAIADRQQGLVPRMENGATYLEVVAADEHYMATFPRLSPPPRPVVVEGWRPRTVLSASGGVLAALLAAAVPVSLWAGDKLIDYGRLQARVEMQRDMERAREERDACRRDLDKVKAQRPTSQAPATNAGEPAQVLPRPVSQRRK